jgi:2-dehydro-3-deoxyphosphogluconate aldolase/(4S)-4-hydroxy-2-oxoglutarate aldolase
MDLNPEAVVGRLIAQRVVPVLRLDSAERTREAVEALVEAGFTTFEITLTTPAAVDVIRELSARGNLLVGAGTVLDLEAASRCLDAGARFLVAPMLVSGLARASHERGAAALIGAYTPGEVLAAHREGADVVKIFPASSGGPQHLAAIHAVFPAVRLCPTGGVNAQNMRDYLKAGAAFVGVGNNIVDAQALAAGDRARVVAHAKQYLEPGSST